MSAITIVKSELDISKSAKEVFFRIYDIEWITLSIIGRVPFCFNILYTNTSTSMTRSGFWEMFVYPRDPRLYNRGQTSDFRKINFYFSPVDYSEQCAAMWGSNIFLYLLLSSPALLSFRRSGACTEHLKSWYLTFSTWTTTYLNKNFKSYSLHVGLLRLWYWNMVHLKLK